MDFNERVIPDITSNYLYQEALARYHFALNYINTNSEVLDLGCGTGYGTFLLSKYARSVIGVDGNSDAIAYSKKKYIRKNLLFEQRNLDVVTVQPKKFDIVCMFEVIEHLRNPNRILKYIKDSLPADGVFVMSTPNVNVFASYSKYHIHEYNRNELTNLLKQYFSYVEIFGQAKSDMAITSYRSFLESQTTRQKFVDMDILRIRKMIPRNYKEKLWKRVGNIFGRKHQEQLSIQDFPISKKGVSKAEYLIAVCKK